MHSAEPTQPTPRAALWPIVPYTDAPAALRFLEEAFGVVPTLVLTRPDDDAVVEHAELRWPLGGGIFVGTASKDDTPFGRRPAGTSAVCVVCTDLDGLFERAAAAGASTETGLVNRDYGSREFTVRDPERNLWTFGTYAGA